MQRAEDLPVPVFPEVPVTQHCKRGRRFRRDNWGQVTNRGIRRGAAADGVPEGPGEGTLEHNVQCSLVLAPTDRANSF